MADETLPGGTQPDNTPGTPGATPAEIDTKPAMAAGADTGAEEVGSTDSDAAAAKPNDGSDPLPRRGELRNDAAGAEPPRPSADGNIPGAATADNEAIAPGTPEAVLSTVESRPAASVGPVVPGRAGGPGRGGPGRGRGGDSRGGGRGRNDRGRGRDDDEEGVESSVIRIYRCSKVVKGGRTFSFAALVVAGDRNGQIGIGYGKANEVPSAVEKATKEARKSMFKFPMKGSTIPHVSLGKSGSSQVRLIPALPGTGVTAGKTVRPILELAGLTDVLTKAYGSTSPKNLLKATVDALRRLQSAQQVADRRGVELEAGAGELAGAAA